MKKYLFLFLMLFVFIAKSNAQENTFTTLIKEKTDQYTFKNHPEKVYIHTDKPYYFTGENIWFSAYLLNGVNHLKTDKSTVLYVELINDIDSIIEKKRLYISDINTAGDFKIPEKINSGSYKIRAYTNYMRNENPEYFYRKEITILSSTNNQNLSKNQSDNQFKNQPKNKEKSFKPNLSFYPEGGYLVQNLKNAVAIKIKDAFFDDIFIDVTIVDENDVEITKFTTSKFGLGLFYLQPLENKNYYAVLNLEGKNYKYKLPNALEKGFVLNTVNNGKDVLINLQTNLEKGLFGTKLVIHQRGNLIYNTYQTATKNTQILKIPKNQLKNGVLHITLFNADKKPVNERLIFVNNPNNDATISINKAKDYYARRRKVTLNLNVKNNENQNIASNLSLSVKDLNIFPENSKTETIKTWLLLNSDLKGTIKNPTYFFEKENERERAFLLDLVMRTNGWRRFTWQSLLYENTKKETFEVEKGIKISGKTLAMKSPYGIKSVPTRFTFFGKDIFQEPVQTSNLKGEFSYGPYVFFDSIPVLLEARLTNFKSENTRDRKVLIVQDKEKKSPKVLKDSLEKKNYTEDNILAFLNYEKYLKEIDAAFKQQENVLNEVIISSKLKSKEEIRDDEMNDRTSYGNSFNRFDVESNNTFGTSAFDLLRNINGVVLEMDSIYIRRFGSNTVPLILYDEMPIDPISLQSISASEVSFIDLLTATEAAIFSNGGIVISIYSKLDNGFTRNNTKRKPGIIDFKAVGFYTAREFFAPDHENGIEEQTKADMRTTLHWVPKIKTSKNGDVSISFFTSDLKSNYLIEVEGITENGIPVYETSKIFVE